MIGVIDNIGYEGNKPNFDRDRMTYDQMTSVTTAKLDIGHIVYCITPSHIGHWKFVSESGSFDNKWIKMPDKVEIEGELNVIRDKVAQNVFGVGYDESTGEVYALVDQDNFYFQDCGIDDITGAVWFDYDLEV